MATTFRTTALGLALEAASLVPGADAIDLTHIEFGSGQYNPIGDETGLTTPFTPRKVYQITAVSNDGLKTVIRALIADAEIFEAYEIGIFAGGTFDQAGDLQSDGTLYALAAHTVADSVLLTKAATDLIVFQGGVTYSNQANFIEGTVILAPLATEILDGLTRRATQADAEDGVENSKFMTSLRTAQQLAISLAGALGTAITALLATMIQATTGTNNTRLMTPLRTNEAMEDFVADFAKVGASTDISESLIPNSIARDNEIESFAKTGTSTDVPTSRIPNSIARDNEIEDYAKTAGSADAPVNRGGTGSSTPSGARTNLGLGTSATQNITKSDSAPDASDGVDGDIWLEY